jgi:ADP-ribosylglycohydrolase
VGDALGVPYEFHNREIIPPFEEIEFEPPEYFYRSHGGVPPGTFSDDGAQALILLDSLLISGKFVGEHFAEGLIGWYDQGFMAVDNKVFDCGIQTAKAISALKSGTEPILAGGSDEYSNGNGSLMRVLPLALWHQGTDRELIADAFDQSAVTHGHLRAKICCAIYCLWARGILNEVENPWENALESFYKYFPKNSIEMIEFETKIIPPNARYDIKGSGYVVDSLRAAHWLNSKYRSFAEVVKAAVALGDDTDTTACIAGGIAGIKFGSNEIPRSWQENLRGKAIYEPLLEKLITIRE